MVLVKKNPIQSYLSVSIKVDVKVSVVAITYQLRESIRESNNRYYYFISIIEVGKESKFFHVNLHQHALSTIVSQMTLNVIFGCNMFGKTK